MKQSSKQASKPKPRRRKPRRIPHSDVIELGHFSTTEHGSDELSTILHRAKLEYTLDVKVRPLDHWIKAWDRRWPHVTAQFWRSAHNRESWDVERSDIWEQYKGKALEVFLDHEVKRAMYEMKAQEELQDLMHQKLRDNTVQAKSFEGMVSALVKLSRLNGDQRESLLSKFQNPTTGVVGGAAFRKADGELPLAIQDGGQGGEEKKEMHKRMARFMLTGKEEKVEQAVRSRGGKGDGYEGRGSVKSGGDHGLSRRGNRQDHDQGGDGGGAEAPADAGGGPVS